jgi:hypothetical protein
MKVRTGLLMLAVATGSLWAQSAPKAKASPATPAATAPAAQTSAKPATATSKPATSSPTAAKTTAKAPVTKATAPKKSSKPAAKPAPAANVATNVATQAKPAVHSSKRDPFVSPVQSQANGPINCGTGKRCLVVDQTVLQGIVKAPNGMIAVVSNSANKAYFLRENDPVYNGFVMRITPDSVVFREQVSDKFGKTSTREIVKKVNAPVV